MAGDAPKTAKLPKTPVTIGRYQVERLLGQGGMGVVWLARDTVLGRRVAVKTLRDDLALPPRVREELIERMRHEARAAAAVSHPNIVTLHDMGEDDAVGLYLVFEYVPGPNGDGPESLRDRLKRGPLALTDVATLARELGDALSFAHEQGVIHRDVKPENVLFSRTGSKIADFGIARIPDSTITRANTVLGTPAYTSPEALSKGDFGPPSDQFSLAATLYEAACGRRAFAGDDAIATAGKVSSEPPPPLEGSLAGPSVLRNIEAALGRGLAKEPSARFTSCADLGNAVTAAIGRVPLATADSTDRIAVDTAAGRIEIERTPLSSRMALVERATRMTSDRPPAVTIAETPSRQSLYARKKTQRVQNVVAAIALLVIVVLILMGKKDPRGGASAAASASASASAPSPQGPAQRAAPKPHPRPAPHPAPGDPPPSPSPSPPPSPATAGAAEAPATPATAPAAPAASAAAPAPAGRAAATDAGRD
jgi:serine/threonine-protein kinase